MYSDYPDLFLDLFITEMFYFHFSVIEPEGAPVFSGADSTNAGKIRSTAVSEKSVSLRRHLFSIITVRAVSFPFVVFQFSSSLMSTDKRLRTSLWLELFHC